MTTFRSKVHKPASQRQDYRRLPLEPLHTPPLLSARSRIAVSVLGVFIIGSYLWG